MDNSYSNYSISTPTPISRSTNQDRRPLPSPPLTRQQPITILATPDRYNQSQQQSIQSIQSNRSNQSIPIAPTTTTLSSKSPVAKVLPPFTLPTLRPIILRGQLVSKIRVNAVLFVGWWLLSRSSQYSSISGYAVELIPSLDSPLYIFECGTIILLCFNIIESLYRLNTLSTLHSPTAATTTSVNGIPGRFMPPARASSPFGTPQTRSSPKTRPSPAMTLSSARPGVDRSFSSYSIDSPLKSSASPLKSPSLAASSNATTIQTPLRHRSLMDQTPNNTSPLGNNNEVESSPPTSIVSAFLARHSPVASQLHHQISDRQSIERLLNSDH